MRRLGLSLDLDLGLGLGMGGAAARSVPRLALYEAAASVPDQPPPNLRPTSAQPPPPSRAVQVNCSPALGIECEADRQVKEPLVGDLAEILATQRSSPGGTSSLPAGGGARAAKARGWPSARLCAATASTAAASGDMPSLRSREAAAASDGLARLPETVGQYELIFPFNGLTRKLAGGIGGHEGAVVHEIRAELQRAAGVATPTAAGQGASGDGGDGGGGRRSAADRRAQTSVGAPAPDAPGGGRAAAGGPSAAPPNRMLDDDAPPKRHGSSGGGSSGSGGSSHRSNSSGCRGSSSQGGSGSRCCSSSSTSSNGSFRNLNGGSRRLSGIEPTASATAQGRNMARLTLRADRPPADVRRGTRVATS